MKLRLFTSTLVMGFAMVAAAAFACPDEKTAEKSQSASAPCGAKAVVTVADKAEDGRSEMAGAKKGCCDQPCDKPCCGSNAVTVSDKSPTAKAPCQGATATTASDKAPCGGAKAATASDKAPCGGAQAVTVSDKAPCGGAKAATASDKAPCSQPCSQPCGSHAKLAAHGDTGDCPISKKVHTVLTSMPHMMYRVGDETIGCSESAKAMAEKAGKPLQFVVGDESFSAEGEAKAKLASVLESELESMQTIQFVAGGKCMKCPMTAKSVASETNTKVTYRVGGVDFESKEAAEKAAKLVSEAVAGVSMKYKVGEKSFCCDKMAGEEAKTAGGKMTYLVGDKETGCSVSAKLMLAEAKLQKVVETAVAASLSM